MRPHWRRAASPLVAWCAEPCELPPTAWWFAAGRALRQSCCPGKPCMQPQALKASALDWQSSNILSLQGGSIRVRHICNCVKLSTVHSAAAKVPKDRTDTNKQGGAVSGSAVRALPSAETATWPPASARRPALCGAVPKCWASRMYTLTELVHEAACATRPCNSAHQLYEATSGTSLGTNWLAARKVACQCATHSRM